MHGLSEAEARAEAVAVLGSSRAEMIEGIRTQVARTFGGSNLITDAHELIHGRWEAGLATGRYTHEMGLAWVRMAEEAGRISLLPTHNDAEVTPGMLKEAIAELGSAEVLGRRKDGTRFTPGLISRGVASFALAGRAKAKAAGKLATFLKSWKEFWGVVLRNAKALKKARAEGRLGADYETMLDSLLDEGGGTSIDAWNEANASLEGMDLAAMFSLKKGADLNAEKRQIPKAEAMPAFNSQGSFDELIARTLDWMKAHPVIETRDGKKVLVENPDAGSLENRAVHWLASHDPADVWKRQERIASATKVHSVAAVLTTLRDAQAKAISPKGDVIYLRRYAGDKLHAVFVRESALRHPDHGDLDGTVSTQYILDPKRGVKDAKVIEDWTEAAPAYSVNPERGAESDRVSTPGPQSLDQQGDTSAPATQPQINATGENVNPHAPGEAGKSATSFSLRPSFIGYLDANPKDETLNHEHRDPDRLFQTLTGREATPPREGARANAPKQGQHGRSLLSHSGLLAWARENGREIDPASFRDVEEASFGGEHIAIRDKETGRMVKITKPGFFGFHADDAGAYLQRWALANRWFGDDVRFEGVVNLPGEHDYRAVISQPFVDGRDATQEEVAAYLRGRGYVAHDGNWVHPILGITVKDTITEGNAILRDSDGQVQPIDWILEPSSPADLRAVREKSGQGGDTSFSLQSNPTDGDSGGGRFSLATPGNGGSILQPLKPLYVSGTDSLEKAHALYGGPQALLRSAAGTLAQSRADHGQGHPGDRGEQEIRALARFAGEAGLMMDARGVRALIDQDPLRHGMEHQVGVLRDRTRVIKDYDTRHFNEETGEVFYKPTDSLFDYLTDHLLANHLFGDDIRLEGFYEHEGSLHVVFSQPFAKGRHPDAATLVRQLEDQGLVATGMHGQFVINAGPAGDIRIKDMHEDNVMQGKAKGMLHPIDVHFSFPSEEARIKALQALGLWNGATRR